MSNTNIQVNSDNTDSLINNNNLLHVSSQLIQNFDKINIKEIEPTTKNINKNIFEGDLIMVVDELVDFIFKELNEGKNGEPLKQKFLNYINNRMIISQEIYNWLLNNQCNSNSIYLLGCFYYNGIGTVSNKIMAINLYHKAAELENIVAQLVLTDIYFFGKGVDKNYYMAFKLSKKLAERGHACGTNNLAFCYEKGIGTDIDKQKAFELYKKVADSGNSTGICNLGWCYYNGIGTEINKQKAFELYQKAAILKNDVAQYNLTLLYENGDGIEKNVDQAIYWCEKSAEQGNNDAQNKLKVLKCYYLTMTNTQFNSDNTDLLIVNNNLLHVSSQHIQNFDKINIKEIEPTTKNINKNIFEGDLIKVVDELVDFIFKELDEGKNEVLVKQNFLNYINNRMIISQEIYNWLLNNQCNSNSIYLLGCFYYNGIGTASNKSKAINLYHKAAELENIVAQLVLTDLYFFGKDVDKDYNITFELSKKLAEGGHARGMINLAVCYEKGIGTDIDEQKAFELYQKVADSGNSTGICNLGWCYYNGIGIDVNTNMAFKFFQKAADLGNSDGVNSLGSYYYGIGTDISKQMAYELYQMAANLENDLAQYNLALMYENGDGIKKDINQAIYWYKKSAEQENEDAQCKLKVLLKK
ncbi:hypothetical protein RclHR1_01080024 [Rhizophagus clarus]|uniref:Uncharacterized protein n=2 Tax=Rhizophagus clarus TaxID=94130 RepID=A0A2Z6QTY0_9GLOM|nr:hypothetical protein RclHR1_01080024 [Rhizophagus clarus]